MKTLKKILATALSLAMAVSLSSGLITTASAEDWAPTATSYISDFSNPNELDSWNVVVPGSGYAMANNALFMNNGAKASYLLPVKQMENVVVEADITHTSGNNYFAILFGSDGTAANISANEMRVSAKNTRGRIFFAGGNRDSGESSGYQWNILPYNMDNTPSDLKQSSKIRLVIYNKRLAAWRNDQLIYTYTLSDSYNGGYVGIENNYYGAWVRSVSVREATANDIVFAESFNEAGVHSFQELTSNNKLATANWGTGSFGKQGSTMTWIDKNKNTIGDHMYSAVYTFGSSNNGATRYMSHMFGITDNEDGTKSGYAVYIKINGDIEIRNITIADTGAVSGGTLYGSASGANTRAFFPDKLGAIGETPVLKMDTPWEYRHILKNGTIYVYLDDVLVCTATNDVFKGVTGYTGMFVSGMNSLLHYFGVRGAEGADLQRPATAIANMIDTDSKEILANKILRFYKSETVTDETTGETSVNETLYGTAYTDANGKFDIELGHEENYIVKLYDSGAAEPTAQTSIKYQSTGNIYTIDFEKPVPEEIEITNVDMKDYPGKAWDIVINGFDSEKTYTATFTDNSDVKSGKIGFENAEADGGSIAFAIFLKTSRASVSLDIAAE